MPEIAPSNDTENILPPAGDCSIQQIVRDKDKDEQIVDYRQQKRQQFDLFQKILL